MTQLDYTHLSALLAVKRAGSFEGAGKLLRISAIGVSRRITKFEAFLGTSLLHRKPTRPTEAGEALCRYAEQIEALETKLVEESISCGLKGSDVQHRVSIALSFNMPPDWHRHVLDAGRLTGGNDPPLHLDITLADPRDTLDLMRSGDVVAALTTSKTPLHGFKSLTVGRQLHLAVATPAFLADYFSEGVTERALRAAPALRLDPTDKSVTDWIAQITGKPVSTTIRQLPSVDAVLCACLRGNGWAVLSAQLVEDYLSNGSLVELVPDTPLTTDLYWHVAQIMTERLSELSASIRGFVKRDVPATASAKSSQSAS